MTCLNRRDFSRTLFLAALEADMRTRSYLPQSAAKEVAPIPEGKVRVILDTDTFNEIDDQFAVAYTLLSADKISVEAIYAAPFHNRRSSGAGDGMEKSYEEILRVLDRLHVSRRDNVFRGSRHFMGKTATPVESPGAQDLIRRATASARDTLYVVAIGAPTNVASALLMNPKIKENIVVVWLGGQPYDFPSAAEFNLQQDPAASRVLYDSGVRLVNIPTSNVSEQLRTTIAELERFLKGKSRIADYLLKIFIEYHSERGWKPDVPRSKVIWDISAVAWLINPGWISTKLVPSPILTDTLTWRYDRTRHEIRVATHANRDEIFGDLFRKLTNAGM
jgi:purine nucleosidase